MGWVVEHFLNAGIGPFVGFVAKEIGFERALVALVFAASAMGIRCTKIKKEGLACLFRIISIVRMPKSW